MPNVTHAIPAPDEREFAERLPDGAPLIGMIVSAVCGALTGSLITLIICSLW